MNRFVAAMVVLVGILCLSIVVATMLGAVDIGFSSLVDSLYGALRARRPSSVPDWQRAIVLDIRLPRAVLSALGGGGLAVAGAVMQSLFRNPMADPGVLGVSAGAALGAVLALYFGAALGSAVWVSSAAFVGALLCAMIVYLIATKPGRTSVTVLLLAGIAVGSIANAFTSLTLSLSLADWEVGRQMLAWLMGGLEGRTWRHVALAAPPVLAGTIWLGFYARELDALLTGEESAMAVGVDVPRVKRVLLAVASLVTASTVAVMGAIAFVGLVVPHAVRFIVGPRHARLLPTCFFAGAVFLLWADMACRTLPVADLRLGVVTAIIGGPFFLYLLVRQRQQEGVQ